ncbi:PfkB family carbohydrate kinase [Neobacillus vireti]|uniref:Indigoidine synthase A-like protein n=1 Tax=Neobacillus vireti LMG 21834 TaxID=1131730 RepID=A0AB94IUT6_9BACI|nr:PfkB family carbohydrate kinase [Neobacillus vireti]ETI70821.1 indigoidine synthase A-like protein [Neobacillus vireti LMG 21834]KLT17641.1 carbohydrate kinase [Neobacillus vireti]
MAEKDFEKLTEKEQLIFDLIRKNPYISQQELAEILGLSRPSIANIISGLTRKGHIIGRAYVLNESQQVICIGGANIDRKFHVKAKAQLGTSNPIQSSQSVGGVARNIAENLGRLGTKVTLLTTSGADSDWSFIAESSSLYMNLDQVAQIPGMSTGSYTAVLDTDGELIIALADMEVYEEITPDLLRKQDVLLSRAKCIMADLNCPKETLQYLCNFAKIHERPIILIPVSSPKMSRLPADLDGVTWLITNRDESETYLNCEIQTEEEWRQAIEKWLSLGIANVVITNGKKGAMIGNQNEGIFHIPSIETKEIVDVTGAGDAFSSAVIYSWLEGHKLTDIAKAGTVNASKTLQSADTVRQDLSPTQLQKDMEELS